MDAQDERLDNFIKAWNNKVSVLIYKFHQIYAHQANDKAAMQAYGFKFNMTNTEIVAELFKMYKQLIKESKK